MYKRLFKPVLFSILMLTIILTIGCSKFVPGQTTDNKIEEPKTTNELVIYSARKEKYVKPLIEKFEAETGIKVKLLTGDESLVNKILVENENVHADIFFSTDVGALEYLRMKGALQPYDAPGAEQILNQYKTPDNSWYPLGARARVLMYNKELISAKEMPKNFGDLTDPKWKGQYMIPRGGNGSMVAHITALRAVWGDEKTKQWVQTLAENAGAIVKDHAEIRRAIGAGEYKIGVVNDNYFYQQLMEEKDNKVGIIYPDQGPDGIGVFVNVSGLGIVKGAPNMQAAQAFIDFVLKPEQLQLYSKVSSELPVSTAVTAPDFEGLLKLGEFKEMKVPFDKIGSTWYDVKKLIEEAGMDMSDK